MSNYYALTPDGLPGNDDGGTMSGWYILSAIGLYPLAGSDQYIVGSPQFPRVDLKVPGGIFTIQGHGASDANIYVQSATLNGQELKTAIIHHADLKAGGSLVLEMGPAPIMWGRVN
jgi:putative alpha-1,2-mannosidase